MFGIPFGQMRLNATFTKLLTMRFRVVRAITEEGLRALWWMSGFAGDRWHAIDQRQQLCHVVAIGRSHNQVERNSVSIGQHMMFATWFPPICGIWAGFVATPDRTNRRTIHGGSRPIDLIGRSQLIQ